jgi:hypothetical protein
MKLTDEPAGPNNVPGYINPKALALAIDRMNAMPVPSNITFPNKLYLIFMFGPMRCALWKKRSASLNGGRARAKKIPS